MKYMGYILAFLLFISSFSIKAQSPCKSDGICVVQFNAGFNEANKVTWLGELKECSKKFIDIHPNEKLLIFGEGELKKKNFR